MDLVDFLKKAVNERIVGRLYEVCAHRPPKGGSKGGAKLVFFKTPSARHRTIRCLSTSKVNHQRVNFRSLFGDLFSYFKREKYQFFVDTCFAELPASRIVRSVFNFFGSFLWSFFSHVPQNTCPPKNISKKCLDTPLFGPPLWGPVMQAGRSRSPFRWRIPLPSLLQWIRCRRWIRSP